MGLLRLGPSEWEIVAEGIGLTPARKRLAEESWVAQPFRGIDGPLRCLSCEFEDVFVTPHDTHVVPTFSYATE